eukprot:365632-Chlamydomonas_euryale.AAC.7
MAPHLRHERWVHHCPADARSDFLVGQPWGVAHGEIAKAKAWQRSACPCGSQSPRTAWRQGCRRLKTPG